VRNNLALGDLTVTPMLRAANGEEFPLPPVTIAPNEIKSVDVSDAVTKSAPQLNGLFDSVVFRYSSDSNEESVCRGDGVWHRPPNRVFSACEALLACNNWLGGFRATASTSVTCRHSCNWLVWRYASW
jgi:hypothetical protein